MATTIILALVVISFSYYYQHLQKDVDVKKPQIDDLIVISKGLSNTGDIPPELSSIQEEWKELEDDLESRKLKINDILAKGRQLKLVY